MHLSIPHVLRGFWLTLACALLLFSVPPLQAQQINPNTAIENIADTAQNLGALGFAVVCLGIALIALMVAVLLFFWKAVSPLLTAIAASNKARDEATAAEREAREEQQEATNTHLKTTDDRERETQALRTRQAEAIESFGKAVERMVDKMNENDLNSEEGRKQAVSDINTHTDEVLSDTKDKLDKAAAHVEQAAATIGDVVTKEHLTAELEPIREELHDIAVTLRKKGDTNPLDPSHLPDTDPAQKSAAKTASDLRNMPDVLAPDFPSEDLP